jgi:hypothetical protein
MRAKRYWCPVCKKYKQLPLRTHFYLAHICDVKDCDDIATRRIGGLVYCNYHYNQPKMRRMRGDVCSMKDSSSQKERCKHEIVYNTGRGGRWCMQCNTIISIDVVKS